MVRCCCKEEGVRNRRRQRQQRQHQNQQRSESTEGGRHSCYVWVCVVWSVVV
jgi:hypothetical protein